jgi:hypothetical protein
MADAIGMHRRPQPCWNASSQVWRFKWPMPLACIAVRNPAGMRAHKYGAIWSVGVSETGLGENSLKGLEPLAHLEIRTSRVEDLQAATAQKGEENPRLGVTVPVSVCHGSRRRRASAPCLSEVCGDRRPCAPQLQ